MRLGIIGCGAIAEGAHIPAALASHRVELTVLSDSSERRLKHLQSRFGLGAIGVVDYRKTFSRVDAVILALPNHLHKYVAIEFLSRGIHVLCEKPLAPTARECGDMCEAARRASAVLAVGYVTRFYPSTCLTKQLLDAEFLGPLYSFDYEFGTEGGWAPLSGYNLSAKAAGGGVLIVSGSHFIDRMIYLFPDIEVTRCLHDGRGGVEANCVVELTATINGRPVAGRVTVSKTHRLLNRLRLVGPRGGLEIGEGQSESVTFFPADARLQHEIMGSDKNESDSRDYFRIQIEDFIHAVEQRTSPRSSGESGSKSIALIERCYEIAEPLSEPWTDRNLPVMRSALPESRDPTAA